VPPATAERLALRLIDQMRRAFDDALVRNWEPLEGGFGLGDPDDEHVLAAAVVGGAGAIVTDNVDDFPETHVPANIQILKPAVFAADTASTAPETALRALVNMSQRRHNPPESVNDLLNTLDTRHGLTEAVEMLRYLTE
jgi:hypothetical protein